MVEEIYRKGIAAAEAGDLEKAYQLFAQVLKHNPKSEKTWLALGRYVTNPEKKEYCLEKVLSLNPKNELIIIKIVQKIAIQPRMFGLLPTL